MGGLGSTGGVWEWQGDEPEQKQTPALRNDNEKGKSNRDDKSHRGPVIYNAARFGRAEAGWCLLVGRALEDDDVEAVEGDGVGGAAGEHVGEGGGESNGLRGGL